MGFLSPWFLAAIKNSNEIKNSSKILAKNIDFFAWIWEKKEYLEIRIYIENYEKDILFRLANFLSYQWYNVSR